jgi:hypothetical protein
VAYAAELEEALKKINDALFPKPRRSECACSTGSADACT